MTSERRYVAVIQARMNSSRLPGKVLMPMAGAPMLQRLVERVRRSRRLADIVVATTDTSVDDPVAVLCDQIGARRHRGAEADVLQRMLDAAELARADVMVRLTGDNPMVDGELVDAAIEAFETAEPVASYLGNADGCGYPYGLFVEVAEIEALRSGLQECDDDVREHVTLHLRRGRAPQAKMKAAASFQVERVTVDTLEDYENVRALFEELYARDPSFSHQALQTAV